MDKLIHADVKAHAEYKEIQRVVHQFCGETPEYEELFRPIKRRRKK